MMPSEAMSEHLQKPDKLKLWCALAEDFETDLPTARAAAGTLAMISSEAVDNEAVRTVLLASPDPSGFQDPVHRCAPCKYCCADAAGEAQSEKPRILDTFKLLLATGNSELVHRAAVGLGKRPWV
jgi:hypothetical protein